MKVFCPLRSVICKCGPDSFLEMGWTKKDLEINYWLKNSTPVLLLPDLSYNKNYPIDSQNN